MKVRARQAHFFNLNFIQFSESNKQSNPRRVFFKVKREQYDIGNRLHQWMSVCVVLSVLKQIYL